MATHDVWARPTLAWPALTRGCVITFSTSEVCSPRRGVMVRGSASVCVALAALVLSGCVASGQGGGGGSGGNDDEAAGRALGEAHADELWRDGHVVLRGVVPNPAAAAEAVLAAGREVLARCSRCPHSDDVFDEGCRGCHRHQSTTGPKSFNKARNVAALSEAARAVARSPRLLGLAAGLLRARRARVYQDTLFEKEQGDVESGWHQDTAAAPLASDNVVTVWVALSDVSPSDGTLMFANGSHLGNPNDGVTARGLPLANRVASVRHHTDDDLASRGYTIVPPRALRAGDATAHLGWTFHRAPPNTGRRSRPALAVTFYADGERVPRDLIAPPGVLEKPDDLDPCCTTQTLSSLFSRLSLSL